MKAFKKYGAARRYAAGRPILSIKSYPHELHIVFEGDMTRIALTEVMLINGDGGGTGFVTLKHLDRLGNANWAEPTRPIPFTTFPPEQEKIAS